MDYIDVKHSWSIYCGMRRGQTVMVQTSYDNNIFKELTTNCYGTLEMDACNLLKYVHIEDGP